MNSKQRSMLKGMAMNIDPIFQIGKGGLTPEITEAVSDALEKRELVKINILKNCDDDRNMLAEALAGRTGSEVVQVIGKKIVLFRYQKDPKKRKIELSGEKDV
ncbi:MAG TPA: ribosome assembly RNA-binding protein YhbY [Candidatus Avilachnospira avicola]|nr:ribosome assembly RNA-binding protein YhbY [Candidatus Avilachnospira avicola]